MEEGGWTDTQTEWEDSSRQGQTDTQTERPRPEGGWAGRQAGREGGREALIRDRHTDLEVQTSG